MRILLLLSTALLLTACVSSGKYKRTTLAFNNQVQDLSDIGEAQRDSIYQLILKLERSRGANDALLLTQDKLQNRLAQQKDELENVKGNLSNTSSRMRSELAEAKAKIESSQAARDSLLANQQQLVTEFEAGLTRAAAAMDRAFAETLPAGSYRINISGGEARLSVQEDVIFEPRSVTRLADDSEIIFRGVMDALQADPLLKLEVVGHTDNKPNPRRGASNWEYAALRANRVAEEFAGVYYLSPNRVVAASQGEFGPLTSNATDEGRATNRRIDFVLRNSVSNLLRELGKLE